MSKTICLIPARGGSKGIPNKNIVPVNDKPLILYAISAIKNSKIKDIYVSTNCKKIKNVAINNNIKVINRPKNISGDNSPTIKCVKHAIKILDLKNEDTIVIIQPTSPLIKTEDINLAIDMFNSKLYDSVISVVKSHSVSWKKNGSYLTPQNHDTSNRIRRQNAQEIFNETGSIYICKAGCVLINNSMFSEKTGYIEIPKSRSFEIDDYEDMLIVEAILNSKNKH